MRRFFHYRGIALNRHITDSLEVPDGFYFETNEELIDIVCSANSKIIRKELTITESNLNWNLVIGFINEFSEEDARKKFIEEKTKFHVEEVVKKQSCEEAILEMLKNRGKNDNI